MVSNLMRVEAKCHNSPIEEASVMNKLSDERVRNGKDLARERRTENRGLSGLFIPGILL
jgi:hypothetical protein